jgi:hypothetical protein
MRGHPTVASINERSTIEMMVTEATNFVGKVIRLKEYKAA